MQAVRFLQPLVLLADMNLLDRVVAQDVQGRTDTPNDGCAQRQPQMVDPTPQVRISMRIFEGDEEQELPDGDDAKEHTANHCQCVDESAIHSEPPSFVLVEVAGARFVEH